MKKSTILATSQLVVLLSIGLIASLAWSEDNLRVGLARSRQVEIRCDGPIEVVLDSHTGDAKELPAGVYTIGVVEAPSFFRAAPLVAGVITTPPQEVIAIPVMLSAPGEWTVDLLRTASPETASRAERDAKTKLKGRIQSFEENGQHVIQMGPFPNEYMARKAEEKARSLGFPARIANSGEAGGYASIDSFETASPRKSRRLQPEGQPVPPPPPSQQPEAEDLQPLAEPFSAQPQEDTYEGGMAPLDLIPEDLLKLDPEPEPTPEPPVLEPIPEPKRADMGPELGWVPAPEKKGKPAPPPERLDTSASRLPRPPQRLTPPPPKRPEVSRQSAPLTRPPSTLSPSPKIRKAPPASNERRYHRPRFADGRRHESPPPAPKRSQRLESREPEVTSPPTLPPEPPQLAEPSEPEPFLRPMPPPPPRKPEYSAPLQKKSEPKVFDPYSLREKPQTDRYAFTPKRERFRIPNVFKSLPIIRRFWWQEPLVGKPLDTTPPIEDLESGFESALSEPVRTAEATEPSLDLKKEPALPAEEEGVSDTSAGEGKVEPEWIAGGPPPEPLPFDPEEARKRSLSEKRSEEETIGEASAEEKTLAPFEAPKPAELPKESSEPPQLEIDQDLLSSESGETRPAEPVEPKEPGFSIVEGPGSAEPAPTEPSQTVDVPAQVRRKSGARTLLVPPIKPVARAYVQVFDENGKPVSDPATIIDLKPLTSSRLEHAGHSYHGSFQAYAPSDEWLVLVNQVDIEDYLAGIIPQEIPPEAPFEVLKAQAIMCRCYALQMVQSGGSPEYGYDIPGDPESEWPYFGRDKETSNVRLAVEETLGEVLVDSTGNLATPVYCFSSGGYVADGQSIWGSSGEPVPEYLEARPDFDPAQVGIQVPAEGLAKDEGLLEEWLRNPPNTFDREAAGEYFRWKRTLSSEQMNSLVNDYWNNQVGEVKSIGITERAISGHATRMTVVGTEQKVEARDADAIREALQLDSSLIVIKEDWRSGWTIYGGGMGHGVGLSQCGAIGLVKTKGANYKQILHFYFSKLKLGRRELVRSTAGA